MFCGISIDNANLYTTSLDLMNHLRGFVRATNAIGQEDKLSSIVSNLLDAIFMSNDEIESIKIGEQAIKNGEFINYSDIDWN